MPQVFAVEDHLVGTEHEISWTHLTAAMIHQQPYYNVGAFDRRVLNDRDCVVLVRNVYDTLASAYFQATRRIKVFAGTPTEFVQDGRFGVTKIVAFYNLLDEVATQAGSWKIIRYHEAREDPLPEFAEVLQALQIPLDLPLLESVIATATKTHMSGLGLLPAYAKTPLAPTDANDPTSFKVRTGSAHRAVELFGEETLGFIERALDTSILNPQSSHLAGCLSRPVSPDAQVSISATTSQVQATLSS